MEGKRSSEARLWHDCGRFGNTLKIARPLCIMNASLKIISKVLCCWRDDRFLTQRKADFVLSVLTI